MKHCGYIGNLKSLWSGREIVRKKLVKSLLVRRKNAGNLKLFWFQDHGELRKSMWS